jgi:hypothetical protein
MLQMTCTTVGVQKISARNVESFPTKRRKSSAMRIRLDDGKQQDRRQQTNPGKVTLPARTKFNLHVFHQVEKRPPSDFWKPYFPHHKDGSRPDYDQDLSAK